MNWNKLDTQKTLQAVKNFSQELQATSSSNEKIEIIKSYSQNKFLRKVLKYVYKRCYINFVFHIYKYFTINLRVLTECKQIVILPAIYIL